MNKVFDTINIHTLIRKLLQTRIPGTIIKFIANYIEGPKTYTTYITHPHNVNSKLAFYRVVSYHPHYLTFALQTPLPRPPVEVMSYADGITITSKRTSTSSPKKYIQPYLHNVLAWTKHNNLTLIPDKTIYTPDPSEYTTNLDLTINNTALPMATQPRVQVIILDPKLTYRTHICNISVHTQTSTSNKTLTATGWGKQKESLMATYKEVMRPALEYASFILDQH